MPTVVVIEAGTTSIQGFGRFGAVYEREPCEVPVEKLTSVERAALA